jgi:hypothetical protein
MVRAVTRTTMATSIISAKAIFKAMVRETTMAIIAMATSTIADKAMVKTTARLKPTTPITTENGNTKTTMLIMTHSLLTSTITRTGTRINNH